MSRMTLRDRLIDPNSPDRRPRRAAYALPTLFTVGNLFLGFYALIEVFQGALEIVQGATGPNLHFTKAAIAIGVAVGLDGLDGRIARMTNTTSDFGRELDSLADLITFGIAPAAMSFAWAVRFVNLDPGTPGMDYLQQAGYFISFIFVTCGAARLARFNISNNAVPTNPGRPDRKYFVGLPIPAAAGFVASVVYAADGTPILAWPLAAAWLAVLGMLSFLMISTWRYRSFKDLNLASPRSPLMAILFASLIYILWNFSQPVLLGMAIAYVGSGIVIRIGGIIRRRWKHHPPRTPEHQVG